MLSRLKLYFTHHSIPDERFIEVLREHNLNPYQEYDKTIHRISMLECVVQIFKELARVSNDHSYDQTIKTYETDIELLRSKEHDEH